MVVGKKTYRKRRCEHSFTEYEQTLVGLESE